VWKGAQQRKKENTTAAVGKQQRLQERKDETNYRKFFCVGEGVWDKWKIKYFRKYLSGSVVL
jgi:hypothetical protein